MNEISGKKISLVLGSGAARGLTHIGVIRVLEEMGAEIDEIVGCSMGAVVGGMYACQKFDLFEEWMRSLTKMDILSLMDFTLKKNGLIKGLKVIDKLKEIIPDTNIENMPIQFSATVTELINEKDTAIRSGSLYDAIRASSGVPGIFTALQRKNEILIDGGVLNPLPLNHVLKRDQNIVVAVNLNARPEGTENNSFTEKQNTISLLLQSYSAMKRRLNSLSIQIYKPDFVIQVPDDIVGFWEFEKADFLINRGRELALNVLNE